MLKQLTTLVLTLALLLGLAVGCDSLPGNKKTQGAVIGGAGGAAAGAVLSKNNRLLGALIGGALGAGGGYLIGAQVEKADDPDDRDEAIRASKEAEANPATAEQVKDAANADINRNGYVTLDEVIAMERAGLSDDEMIRRLRLTNQIFELTTEQENRLRNEGVSNGVLTAMWDMNRAGTTYATPNDDRISRDPNLIP